jgi:secretion/DNA translocation related CpaE-like protein
MAARIGLVGTRADLAVEVAALAARTGATVVSVGLGDVWVGAGGATRAGVDLVLVDAAAVLDTGAQGSGGPGDPPRGVRLGADRGVGAHGDRAPGAGGVVSLPVLVLCRAEETGAARDAADALGASHVVELPLGAPWLVAQLAPEHRSTVLGVVGAVGGAGATTVAIACAVGAGRECLLVDADPDSPGLDLPLGIAEGSGVRWPQIPDTDDPLDPGSLRSALPRVGHVSVITGSGLPGASWRPELGWGPVPGQVQGIVGAGRADFARTVVDAGRGRLVGSLLGPGDAVVLVLPATLAGVVAGRRVLADLPTQQVLVLLRPSGWLPADEVAEQLDWPVALEVPRLGRASELADCGDLLAGRTGRALGRLGEQIWARLP